MAANEYLLVDILFFIYNATWLIYLTKKHYGKVTTTAGHIFELNVLVNVTLDSIYFILVVDLEILPMSILSDIFDRISLYSLLVAIAGSQIETAIFLKTLNVNTMMTNTAGKIIVALTISSCVLGLINTLLLPTPRMKQSENFDIEFCNYLPPTDLFMVIPVTLLLMLVLSVMGFGVFRGLQIKRTQEYEELSDNLCLKELRQQTGLRSRDAAPQGRLFTIQAAISELNQVTPREIIDEDLVIQDIGLNH